MSMIGIATLFLGIFTGCKFVFVNLVFFNHETWYFFVKTEWQYYSGSLMFVNRLCSLAYELWLISRAISAGLAEPHQLYDSSQHH